ncbi:MAG: glycosyltransferase [Pseudolabrys sp.]
MLTAIVATHESERTLVRTLAALVPGATAGLVAEAIVADAGSRDATAEVADLAGCRFMNSAAPLGARLREAAALARAPWLLFLRAGMVPEPGWVAAVDRFIAAADMREAHRAAVFRPPAIGDLLRPGLREMCEMVRVALGGGARPDQGLLISRRHYDALGGHPDARDSEAALLRKLGRRRIAMLSAGAASPG